METEAQCVSLEVPKALESPTAGELRAAARTQDSGPQKPTFSAASGAFVLETNGGGGGAGEEEKKNQPLSPLNTPGVGQLSDRDKP